VTFSAQQIDQSHGSDCAAVRRTLELAPLDLLPAGLLPLELKALELKAAELAPVGGAVPAALAEAVRHLDACPACQAAVRRQAVLDRKIGDLLRDVPVPEGLATRLLQSLERASAATAGPALAVAGVDAGARPVSETAPRRRGRRWVISLAAACVLAAIFGAWRLIAPPLSLEGLIVQAETAMPTLPECDKHAWPPLPTTMNTRLLVDAPRALPGGPAAVFFFEIPPARGRPAVSGRLLAVPVSRLGTPPAGTGFLSRAAVYRGLGFCASSWVEGDFAYVCLVEGGERELHLLERARPAAI
jgi:hypothetical protein